MHQIAEAVSMAPHVAVDESRERVAGGGAQALVLQSPAAALVAIRQDKSKETMRDVFWMALRRPLVADMYLAGNSFGGAIQTCNVHVWRKSESLAVEHGTESPEQAYSEAPPPRVPEGVGRRGPRHRDGRRPRRIRVRRRARAPAASRVWPNTPRRRRPG